MSTIKIHLREDEDHDDGWDVELPAQLRQSVRAALSAAKE